MAEQNDRFERLLSLTLGWALFIGMISWDLYTGALDKQMSNQQLMVLLARYGFAGVMIKPDLIPAIVDVIKAFKSK